MAYFYRGSSFYTLAGIKRFTAACNAGKLNTESYAGEPIQTVREKISLRRRMFLEAVESAVAGIMVTPQCPALLGDGGASKRKRADEDAAGGSTIDGLNAKVAELERRLGASEAKEREAQAKVAELELVAGLE
jgi:hypothetical protein